MLVAALLTACASVPMATSVEDIRAKSQRPPPGLSLLYVYRNQRVGGAVKIELRLNGQMYGETASRTFFVWVIPPGVYTLESTAEDVSYLRLVARPNMTYFVHQEVLWGFMYARSRLRLVSDRTGRKGVAECELADHSTY